MRKIKYSRLVTILIFMYVVVQLGLNIFSKNIDTLVLENEQIDLKVSTKGLVIRDEYVVYSDSAGQVDMMVKEGEKIAKSQDIATIYSNKTDVEIGKEIEVLNDEIESLKNGEKNIASDDITKLNNEIDTISSRIQGNLVSKNFENISADKESIQTAIEERNRLLNNDVNSKNLETKENKKDILSERLEKNSSILSSEISGIVSYKFDGNEELYNIDKLPNITKKDINNADNEYEEINLSDEQVKSKDPILRLVDNKYVFVAICVDKEQSQSFELNDTVKLNCNNKKVNAKIDNIYEDTGNTIIIFKITDQNIGIYDTRVEEFDIIYKQIDGLKIPKQSVKVVDDIQGVYVINPENEKPGFVKLDGVVHEDDDYVYIDSYNNAKNGIDSISLYDEIILNPNSINKNIKIK